MVFKSKFPDSLMKGADSLLIMVTFIGDDLSE